MMENMNAGNILPPEITEAILCRLPPKSLGQFKSVSKTWNSLISHPRLIKNHVHHNHHHHGILVSDEDSLCLIRTNELLPYLNSDYDIPTTAERLSVRVPVMQWGVFTKSCNGLVLDDAERNGSISLVNPTTRELWKVPPSPFGPPYNTIEFFPTYGFGYDSFTDDYKVVRIMYPMPGRSERDYRDTYVSVYSLRKNSWKELPNLPYSFNGVCCALVGHNYHWLGILPTIIAFSLVDEVFNEIKLPVSLQDKNLELHGVVEIGGKLGLFLGFGYGYEELWVMQEYGVAKSWARVFSHQFIYGAGSFSLVRPVCFVEGSDRDVVLAKADELLVFNMDEGRFRKLSIVGGPTAYNVGGTFVESIESPKRIINELN